MSVLDNLTGQSDVLLEGLGGSINHNGGEAAIDAALAQLEGIAVVQVQHNGNIRILDYGSLNQLHQVGVVGISAGALGNLEDNGAMQLTGSLGDTLDDFHVVDVESTDCVAAIICLLEHLGRSNKCHWNHSFPY